MEIPPMFKHYINETIAERKEQKKWWKKEVKKKKESEKTGLERLDERRHFLRERRLDVAEKVLYILKHIGDCKPEYGIVPKPKAVLYPAITKYNVGLRKIFIHYCINDLQLAVFGNAGNRDEASVFEISVYEQRKPKILNMTMPFKMRTPLLVTDYFMKVEYFDKNHSDGETRGEVRFDQGNLPEIKPLPEWTEKINQIYTIVKQAKKEKRVEELKDPNKLKELLEKAEHNYKA